MGNLKAGVDMDDGHETTFYRPAALGWCMAESADAVHSRNSTVWCRLGVMVGRNANRSLTVAARIRLLERVLTAMSPGRDGRGLGEC